MRVLAAFTLPLVCGAASVAWAQGSCTPAPCAPGAPIEMQFTLSVVPTGQGGDGWPANVWNGPGPTPTTLQETFFVDPASASGTYLTEPGRQGGAVLGHIDESFTASDIMLTANGRTLQQSSSGMFTLSGDRASNDGPPGTFFGGLALPVGGGGSDFASQFAQAPPDWAAFLSTANFHTDTGLFTVSGAFGQLDVVPLGQAVVVSVPEPPALPLCVLAVMGLLAAHWRRLRAPAPRPMKLAPGVSG